MNAQLELSSGPAAQFTHHLWTVQTTVDGCSVTSDMRQLRKALTYLFTYLNNHKIHDELKTTTHRHIVLKKHRTDEHFLLCK